MSSLISDLIDQNRADEAVEFGKLAAELHSDSPYAHMIAGDAYYANGKEEKAVEFYAKGLIIDPSHSSLLNRFERF